MLSRLVRGCSGRSGPPMAVFLTPLIFGSWIEMGLLMLMGLEVTTWAEIRGGEE